MSAFFALTHNEAHGGIIMVTDLSVLLQDLVISYQKMLSIAGEIEKLSKNTKMLSFNSSIEAARAGEAGKGFTIIANEIKKFSEKSQEANDKNLKLIENFHSKIYEVIGVRIADIAFDLIDKIDRNLFERNCDVQAWATFDSVIQMLLTPNESNYSQVSTLLHNLVEIYEVYYDVYLTDLNGKIVAVGVNKNLVGKDIAHKSWYQETQKNRSVTASDMYVSEGNQQGTIAYSCPVHNKNGETIGILSTRFNWNYIYDIIEQAKIGNHGEVYIINKEGVVIAAEKREEVLVRNLSQLEPVRLVLNGTTYGYTIEKSGNDTKICGYALTKGYNTYKGKEWTVLVIEDFR
jgi:hypothetical protein